MKMLTDDQMPDHLRELGRALDRAVRIDLAAEPRRRLAWRLHRPRHVAIGAVLAAIAIPATALAATQLFTARQVAASLPRGAQALAGTHATCTVVRQNVEYHCVLSSAPNPGKSSDGLTSLQMQRVISKVGKLESGGKPLKGGFVIVNYGHQFRTIYTKSGALVKIRPAGTPFKATDWKGTTEITVDAAKRIDGGCRSLNTKGTDWQCYLGQAAVSQHIIVAKLLGQYAPTPSVG